MTDYLIGFYIMKGEVANQMSNVTVLLDTIQIELLSGVCIYTKYMYWIVLVIFDDVSDSWVLLNELMFIYDPFSPWQ